MTGKRLFRPWYALGALLLTAGFGITSDTPPSTEDLVRHFDTVVFGSELGDAYASEVVAKWHGTIRLDLQGRVDPGLAEIVGKHFRAVLGLTGLKIEPRGSGKDYNFKIVFVRGVSEMRRFRFENVDRRLIETLASDGGCYFLALKQPPGRIVKAAVVVNVDHRYIDHCLLEEITQSLGLPNDSDIVRPSIFSGGDRLSELSRSDRILVKTLYHSRMKPGLPRREALVVAREIISAAAGGGRY